MAAAFTILVLAGCAAIPGQMVGRFNASPDVLMVKADGKIFWSPDARSATRPRFVGIGAADKHQPNVLQVTIASASPLWPEITYSQDYSRIAVRWHEVVAGSAAGRSSEYRKVGER